MNDTPRSRSDSLDDVLGADHARLDALLSSLTEAIDRRSQDAVVQLKRFSGGLVRHMTWENEVLFPAVRGLATPAQRKSIESLEIDHERLRETLGALDAAVAAADFGAARDHGTWLKTLLQGHNYDEEHGVYVEADRLLTADDRRRLAEQFRGVPEAP
jgi:regulator of cell morphogenesis and NO signaling